MRAQLLACARAADRRDPVHPCACRPRARHRRHPHPEPHRRPAARRLRRGADHGRAAAGGSTTRSSSGRRRISSARCWCRSWSRSATRSRPPGCSVQTFEQDHGFMPTLGLRVGGFGYSTDVVKLDDAALALLAGVDIWVVDCFQRQRAHDARQRGSGDRLVRAAQAAAHGADAYGLRHGLGLAAGAPAAGHRARLSTGWSLETDPTTSAGHRLSIICIIARD